jgi:hypothetical protein
MPMRGELPTVTARSSYARTSKIQAARSLFATVMSDQDLQCVAIFCAIGLLVAINMALRVPQFGVLSVTLQSFP